MIAIAFTFLASRYHATPWGRHVNEADVAWPPDLWRITRALIAVWHRKVDQRAFPRERLSALLACLAEAQPPSYCLPEVAIHSHTRHYMPSKGDKKTLVFDAFARVPSDVPVVIAWSDVTLDALGLEMLDVLLWNLGFLGRAESWVEACRINFFGAFNCVPASQIAIEDTGEVTDEIVRLLAPLAPTAYAKFRDSKLADAEILLEPDGKPPANLKGDNKKLVATLPADWIDGLEVDTGELQAAGWSAPTCAQIVSYRRPLNALQAVAPKVITQRVKKYSTSVITTARFALYGKPLPRIEDAVRVGEALRRTTMGLARRLLGADALPTELSGHGLEPTNRHGHAFWLPEDADNDGAIDHLLIHAPQGFGPDAIRVMTALQVLKYGNAEPLRLMLEGVGQGSMFETISTFARSATVWRSATPYLYPWHLKKSQMGTPETVLAGVFEQIHREWGMRCSELPAIETVSELPDLMAGGRSLKPLHFHRFRNKRGLTQPDRLGWLLELRFAASVRGPLALGFGCHFGLGLFVPSEIAHVAHDELAAGKLSSADSSAEKRL